LSVEPVWWHFLFGIVCALLPDIDAIPELIAHGRIGQKQVKSIHPKNHRTFLHYPVVHIFLGLWLYGAIEYVGMIYLLATGLHLVRDMLGTGWGIKALWPLSDKNYRFFSHCNNEFFTTQAMSDEETAVFAEAHGNSNWLEETYLRLTWISGIEYSLFVIALLLLVWHLVL